MQRSSNEPAADIPRLIKDLRTAKGLTQEQLARRLDVTFATVNGWENGKHRPLPAMVKRLARLAQVARSPVTLVSDEIDPIPEAWPRGEGERRDFYHRIREFPDEVSTWRAALVAAVPLDPRFGRVSDDAPREDIRKVLDLEIARLREMNEILHVLHGTPTLGNKRDPVDELVYIILSRKTPEVQYQKAFADLKGLFKTWDALLRAPTDEVRRAIGSGGLATKKEASIRGALHAIRDRFGRMSMADAEDWTDDELEKFLCSLPEISRKSAYCVMMFAFGRAVFPVDSHVGRVLQRAGVYESLGLSLDGLDHKQLQATLATLVPPTLRRALHVNLLSHGRSVCTAMAPRCGGCDIARFCSTARRRSVEVTAASTAPIAIDMFCGAGGLSAGLHRAGITTVAASDIDEVALRTFALNHPGVPVDAVLCRDIRQLDAAELRKTLGGRPLDILAGAPPCQGFSSVGVRSKRRAIGTTLQQDTRNYLYEDFVRLAAELKPRIVLFENVPGMESARVQKESFVDLACKLLRAAGYTTVVWKLDASRFGVPQLRSRIFVVGSLTKALPAKPEGEYSTPRGDEWDPYAPRPIGLGHAIFDLPPLRAGEGRGVSSWNGGTFDEKRARRFVGKFNMRTSPRVLFNHTVRTHNERDLELYEMLGQGEDSMHIVERGRRDLMRYRTDAFDDKYMRLDEEVPCKTIVAHLAKDGNGYVHPTQTRSISFREAARVQTFHDNFAFCGSASDQWVQLGNAVPPLLGEAIGRSLKNFLERSGK